MTDALSKVANQSGSAKKLLHTHFYDGTLTVPTGASLSKSGPIFYYGQWTGDDSRGYDSSADINAALDTENLGSYCRTEIILTPTPPKSPDTGAGDVVANDYTDIAPVYAVSYAANDIPGGIGNKVVLQQLKRSCNDWGVSTPQIWSHIVGRNDWATVQIPELLYSFQVKMPDNIADILDGRSPYPEWFELFFIKAHSANASTDSRIAVKLYRDATTRSMKFEVVCDLFVKDLAGVNDSFSTLWSLKSPADAVVADHEYQIDLWFKPPTGLSDISGEVQILIIDLTDQTVAMQDRLTNIVMCGYYGYNYARIAFGGLYTGGFPSSGDITMEYGNFILWQKPGGILPHVTAKKLYDLVPFCAPLTSDLNLSAGTGSPTSSGFTPDYNADGLLMTPSITLTYPSSGNYNNAAGTWLLVVTKDDWSTDNGVALGKTGVGIMLNSAYSGVTATDGTDIAYGPTGTPSGKMVIGVRFSGTKFQCFSNGQFGTVNNNFTAASFVFSTLAVMSGCSGRVRNVSIFWEWHTDEEIQKITRDLLAL